MGRKDLERLSDKPCSMHLAVPGALAHTYNIQRVLSQAVADRACMYPESHHEMVDWRKLEEQTAARPTHLAETHMGFCDASGIGSGGVWLYPSCLGKDLVWQHPCPADIFANLVSSKNREGTITNSDLELTALVLHKATLIAEVPDARLAVPHSGFDNTPTVSWSTKEALTTYPVFADLLRIRTLHSRQF